MDLKCPQCGLISPDSALRCDCGYLFSPTGPRTQTKALPAVRKPLIPGWSIISLFAPFVGLFCSIGAWINAGVAFGNTFVGFAAFGILSAFIALLRNERPRALTIIALFLCILAIVLALNAGSDPLSWIARHF